MNYEISGNTSVAEVVIQYPQTRRLLEEMGIDYCCGGKHSLKDACSKAGLPWQNVIGKLKETIEQSVSEKSQSKNWTEVPLTELVQHIIDAHHKYLKENLPRLKSLSDKVYNAHKQHHGEMIQELKRALETLRIDIEMHLAKEEQILFPLIKEMEVFANNQGPKPTVHCGSVENPIRQMEAEHDAAGNLLERMRKITSKYRLPDDACESFKALYDGLKELEKDLHEHIHLENNILFPKAVELEKNLGI